MIYAATDVPDKLAASLHKTRGCEPGFNTPDALHPDFLSSPVGGTVEWGRRH